MDESFVETVAGGVSLKVYTQPRASRTRVVGIHDGMLKIACTSPPVDGKANKELIDFFSKMLHVAKRDIELKRGQSSRRKQFFIRDLDLKQISDAFADTL